MRVRLIIQSPLPMHKLWYEVDPIQTPYISDLENWISTEFNCNVELSLEVEGFELGRNQRTKGIIREGDIIM